MKNKSLLFAFLFVLACHVASSQEDCLPVKKLRVLYAEDASFRKVIKEMFDHLADLPDGTPNPWKGKGVDDLYQFLNDWFYFLPTTQNGLDKILEFSMLYYHNPYGMKFVREEPGYTWAHDFIEERGKFMDSPASAAGIAGWLADQSIKHEDFVMPLDGFKTFNDFFTRDLKPGTRTVAGTTDDRVLVSPADGVINMINNDLKLDTPIPTKGRMTLNLNALLANSSYASRFVGGTAVAVFLKPDNYHHYHSPVSGTVVESRENVGDRLFGMPDIPDIINGGNVAYNKDYSVFENFRHGYLVIETEQFGHIGMIPIGLQTIGSVVFRDRFKSISQGEETTIYKGEEIGYFAYGGSTVLLIFEKGTFQSLNVQQGQQIGLLQAR